MPLNPSPITFDPELHCPTCSGNGVIPESCCSVRICYACAGSGKRSNYDVIKEILEMHEDYRNSNAVAMTEREPGVPCNDGVEETDA